MALPNTHLGAEAIGQLLGGRKNLFFAGIGGVSMNALAHISHLRGHRVSGYDRTPSHLTKKLESMGIPVFYEANAAHVRDCDALIYTVAMPDDNPEYAYCLANGIPVISRSDYLGYLMMGYSRRIGVSGTHGKSTTTGMLSRILTHAGTNPTVFNGAPMKETGSVDRIGGHEFFVFEACEYMDSFLDFNPTAALVLNIELDHVDYFHSLEQIRQSFHAFLARTGQDGLAVYNADDENCRLAVTDLPCRTVSFGRSNPDADYTTANEDLTSSTPAFDVLYKGRFCARIFLKVPGEHSILDGLAAFAVCHALGLDGTVIAEGLSSYEGIARRMEKICVTASGAVVYSDYGHHPTEIVTTINGARKLCQGKLHVVFQPHTFSRTAELFDDFADALSTSGADDVLLCPIYPARETNIYGVSSEKLADAVSSRGKTASAAPDFESAARMADASSGEGDMILVMGAGDVVKVTDILKNSDEVFG